MTNGLSFLGWILIIVGWGILLLAPGDMHLGVVNFHMLALANAAIISGAGFLIAGAVNEGFARLLPATPKPQTASQPEPAPETDTRPAPRTIDGQPPNFNLLKKTHYVQLGAFGEGEVHEMRGGEFVTHRDGAGWGCFESLADAMTYLKTPR